MRQESLGSRVFDVFNIFIMLIILVAVLFPIFNIISVSMSDARSVSSGSVYVWPKGFTLQSYLDIFKDKYIASGYINSIIYSVGSTFVMLLFTSLFAYPLTVQGFAGKKFLTIFLMITMFFSGGLIPTYLLIRSLGMLDTVWVMILPAAVGAYNVFLFRTFFQNIPSEVKDAALIDGANEVVSMFRIILPLSKPLLATFALFGIVGSWNAWFEALIYLQSEDNYPLQMILRNYLFKLDTSAIQGRVGAGNVAVNAQGSQLDPQSIRMAVVIVTMFPIMVIYPFFQKYFTKGMFVGSIKG